MSFFFELKGQFCNFSVRLLLVTLSVWSWSGTIYCLTVPQSFKFWRQIPNILPFQILRVLQKFQEPPWKSLFSILCRAFLCVVLRPSSLNLKDRKAYKFDFLIISGLNYFLPTENKQEDFFLSVPIGAFHVSKYPQLIWEAIGQFLGRFFLKGVYQVCIGSKVFILNW